MKDKKSQFLMTAGHLLHNQWVIYLLVVGFKGIRPNAQHMNTPFHCTTLYLGCCLSLPLIKDLQEMIFPWLNKLDLY